MIRINRELKTVEKLLLLLLTLGAMGFSYYHFIFAPQSRELAEATAQRAALEDELNVVTMRITQITQMQEEMSHLEANSSFTRMASYNDSKGELALLDMVLLPTREYTISFHNLSREGDLVRRSFSLQFTVGSLDEAERVLDRLIHGGHRCLVGDVSCTVEHDRDTDAIEAVHIGMVATFYETMADGTEDMALREATTPES